MPFQLLVYQVINMKCISISPSIISSIHSLYPPIFYPSIHLPSIHSSILYLPIQLFIYPSINLSIHIFLHLSVHPSTLYPHSYPSIHLFIHLLIHPYPSITLPDTCAGRQYGGSTVWCTCCQTESRTNTSCCTCRSWNRKFNLRNKPL